MIPAIFRTPRMALRLHSTGANTVKTRFACGVVSLWDCQDVPQPCAKTSSIKNALVLDVLKAAFVPMTATEIAEYLEVRKIHWWTNPTHRRISVFQALQRINAFKHKGGFYTLPLSEKHSSENSWLT